ncbi:MAG TPA: A24 family peptidase [Terriglobales bacterium]|jgi:prepilin peptidase CpaA
MKQEIVWGLALLLALVAGGIDWKTRRIPNWLTVSGFIAGFVTNTVAWGWPGSKAALLGAGLGLLVLLPFVWVRSLGAGDWKLVGALGAIVGPAALLDILVTTIIVAGVMAVILIVWKRRVGQTLRNLRSMLVAMMSLHVPPADVSLDNPQALKVPFGVAVAVAVVLLTARQAWGVV